MPGLRPSHPRHAFLAGSALVGALALIVPLSPAEAASQPPGPGPAERIQPTPAAQPAPGAAQQFVLVGAEAVDPTGDRTIRPFRYRASDEELAELKRRIAATRWPSRELVQDGSQGVQLATMRKLADHWANDYDWRKVEARLDSLPQFVTTIDGLDIHFIHVRSERPDALPLIITHGWPGSIIEELKVIGPLTDPAAHGGDSGDSFHLVIPSIPGYGFSGKPTALGWEPVRIARAWAELMDRLGYAEFVASGGDWGDPITEQLAVNFPGRVRAIHLNMPSAVPPEIFAVLQGGARPATLTEEEERAVDQLQFFFDKGLGYANEMRLRPQTLYALEDSPVGLAAWILDHDRDSYELIARVFDGELEGLSRDDVLDNITLYWLTRTAVSSARLYWENRLAFFAPQGVEVPVAVSAFPTELYQVPRSWAERAFPKLVYYRRHAKGGHFPAWEQPQAFAEDVRAGFRSLRS